MGDREIKFLTASGLALQAIAIGLGFTSLGWRWPVASATIAVAAGIAGVILLDGGKIDGVQLVVFVSTLAALAAGVWHAASAAPAAAWTARIAFGLETVLLLFVASIFLFFKLDRLW